MNQKNLQRAREIAEQLPALEDARSIVAGTDAVVIISRDGTVANAVSLPHGINYNVANILNAEINRLKQEIKEL